MSFLGTSLPAGHLGSLALTRSEGKQTLLAVRAAETRSTVAVLVRCWVR